MRAALTRFLRRIWRRRLCAAIYRQMMMSDTYAIVRQAILDKRQIVATYRGHRREMCPHVIGTKNGREQALFFQFAGSSNSGLPPGGEWRCIPIEDLTDISSRPGRWHGAAGTRPQTCVDRIDVRAAAAAADRIPARA
jgi:hypothetical protein